MSIEQLLETYEYELTQLVRINEKNDFSPAGDAEFERQKERVKDAKEAIIRASQRPEWLRTGKWSVRHE
jgi:hypothetical protein